MTKIGKNILENLTTGMYADSKIIYREYIQNACDQIDIAKSEQLLKEGEELIDIFIDPDSRYISIRDNATGVTSREFNDVLGDIANSNKVIGKNKGFRGIGRLCGLAYCKKLKFSTSFKGESIKSIMIFDALHMREMIYDKTKYSAEEVWSDVVTISTEKEDVDSHYFEVELIDVNKENSDLLDKDKIVDYLSFVAPVPYKNKFIFCNKIYDHAKKLNFVIDEYCIKVNGFQVFKEYSTNLKKKTSSGLNTYDEISDLFFQDFKDENGKLIAWLWFGVTRFEKQIPEINKMRGLRLRSSNIQIGNSDTLQGLFKEPRGNSYFVGEVFAVDTNLIPNSQRDYFNENVTRIKFEDLLRYYFGTVLHKLYYAASQIKNAYQAQIEYLSKVQDYQNKKDNNSFLTEKDFQEKLVDIEKSSKKSDSAKKKIDKFNKLDDDSVISLVNKNIKMKYDSPDLSKRIENAKVSNIDVGKDNLITSNMSKLTKSERKLVEKILSIISALAPYDIAEKIAERIKEEVR